MEPEGCIPIAKGYVSTPIEFTCEVEGGVAYWEMADRDINNPEELRKYGIVINGTETHIVLTTTSDALNELFDSDEIKIRCIVLSYNPFTSVAGNFSYILRYGKSAIS